jgi:hypothetical protein
MKTGHVSAAAAPIPFRTRLWSRERDYAMFRSWWEGHHTAPVPLALLPEGGIIVEHSADGETWEAAMAAWLYLDNSVGVAFLGWFVSNPDMSARVSHAALPLLVQAARVVARGQGRHSLYCPAGARGIQCYLRRAGWQEAHPAIEFWDFVGDDGKGEN